MSGRGRATAGAVGKAIEKARRFGTLWREEATTVVGGWRVKTTPYDDFDDSPAESGEAWGYVDALDEPQAGDEIAFAMMGDRPIVIGKVARAVATVARLSRTLRFTSGNGLAYYGTTPSYTLNANAGVGATALVEGSDRCGRVQVVTGSSAVASGILIRITFATAMANTDYAVRVSCADSDSAEKQPYCDYNTRTTTYFEISLFGTPNTSRSYQFFYEVAEYEP